MMGKLDENRLFEEGPFMRPMHFDLLNQADITVTYEGVRSCVFPEG